jgi:hypothetical protein
VLVTQGQTRWCASPQIIMRGPGFYAALAKSILAGESTPDAILARLSRTLGREWRWLRPLVRRYRIRFDAEMRPRRRDVIRFLKADEGLARALSRTHEPVRIASWIAPPGTMQPARAARGWQIPAIESVGALADCAPWS